VGADAVGSIIEPEYLLGDGIGIVGDKRCTFLKPQRAFTFKGKVPQSIGVFCVYLYGEYLQTQFSSTIEW
jgi:hypothetical protein